MTKIKTTLYNGEVELMFQAYGHKYTVTDKKRGFVDKKVRSVTQANDIIAKPALIGWAARMAAEYFKDQIEPGKSYDEIQLVTIFESAKGAHWKKKVDAGNLGTFVHNWVEDYINGKNPAIPVNKKLKDAVQRFLDWQKAHKVGFLLSEQQVYSRKYIYTGTLDFICKIDGKMYIGDLKTSSGIFPEMLIQTAAYRFARSEEYPKEKYVGQVIVRVGKEDGELEVAVIKSDEWYKIMFTAFVAALKLSESIDLIKEFRHEKL
jgi:hypothetical protein